MPELSTCYLQLMIITLILSLLNFYPVNPDPKPMNTAPVVSYDVLKLESPMKPDGNWNKAQWQHSKEIEITQRMGPVTSFTPTVRAKMMYDDQFVYIIFKVQDHYVRSIANTINGRIWEDSCVEFFFAPDVQKPLAYFNLEINCGGFPLFHFKDPAVPGAPLPSVDDIKKIEIAHSMPSVVDPEITTPQTWTLEYRIPVEMLQRYASVTRPVKGAQWKANFYKCGDKTSNPHWLTWSVVQHPTPNFHLPEYFGTLNFK